MEQYYNKLNNMTPEEFHYLVSETMEEVEKEREFVLYTGRLGAIDYTRSCIMDILGKDVDEKILDTAIDNMDFPHGSYRIDGSGAHYVGINKL